jgi:putative flippase GtrA
VGLLRMVFPAIGFAEQTEFVAHVAGLTVSAITSFFGHRAFSFRRASLR